MLLHLRELLPLPLGARDDCAVLETLLGAGCIADEGALLADVVGLCTDFGLALILDFFILVVEAALLQSLLLGLELGKLRLDVGVDKVVHVPPVVDLWDFVKLPVGVLEQVVLLKVDVVDTGAAFFSLDIALEFRTVGVLFVVLSLVADRVGDEGLALDAADGTRDVDAVEDVGDVLAGGSGGGVLELLLDAGGEEALAGLVADIHDAFFGVAGETQHLDLAGLCDGFEEGEAGRLEVFRTGHIDLVDDEEDDLVGEEGLDGVEELDLGLDGVAALFREVDEVEDGGAEMGNGRDGLHLDRVHLFEGVVEDAGGVDGLEAQVLVVKVADVERFGGEGVRLDVDVGPGDGLQEGGLADVGVSADEEGAGVGVDGGETAKMLPDLLEVLEGALETAGDGGHAAEGGALELLALEERLSVLDETDIVTGDLLDQVLGGRELAEGDPEVVRVVEGVHEGAVEGVDVLETGEGLEDRAELLGEGLLRELDLAQVERWGQPLVCIQHQPGRRREN